MFGVGSDRTRSVTSPVERKEKLAR
eukprot:COSAG02_NODE_40328_length_406_cov_9.280130_1_plen_24_part_10